MGVGVAGGRRSGWWAVVYSGHRHQAGGVWWTCPTPPPGLHGRTLLLLQVCPASLLICSIGHQHLGKVLLGAHLEKGGGVRGGPLSSPRGMGWGGVGGGHTPRSTCECNS